MTGKEFNLVRSCINKEGFDYCFEGYSDFKEIKDLEFHRLRNNYLIAREALIDYLGWEPE